MNIYVFPGQGAQFPGMGLDLYKNSKISKSLFEKGNEILGFAITDIMFGNDAEALKQTKVTQPAIFMHSVILAKALQKKFKPDFVAGHSLGEFSALVATDYLSYEDGLSLVYKRAIAMQKACEQAPSTMAAILGLDDKIVEDICDEVSEIVVPANYNCPGQLVISGSKKGIDLACEKLLKAGAKRALKLPVGGAFHSPLMEPAKQQLEEAILTTKFNQGICPIFQNTTALPTKNVNEIKVNLIQQLTASVKWTQTMQNMIKKNIDSVTEVGPGKVLQGLFKKVDRQINTFSAHL